jgi:hypothetical protein
MFIRLLILTLGLLALSGCANRPETITPSYVSHEKYSNIECEQLSTYLNEARYKLMEFSNKQDTKANIDAGGVFFALIPVSSLSGDYHADVAKWKGEVQAIETAQYKNKCKEL